MSIQDRLEKLLGGSNIHRNASRSDLIQACVDNGEAFVSKNRRTQTCGSANCTSGKGPSMCRWLS